MLMPILSQYFGAGQNNKMRELYSTATVAVGITALPICIGGIAIAPSLVKFLFGSTYSPVVTPLRVLLVANTIGVLSGPGAALFLALGKPLISASWGVPIAALNIMLAFFLVPMFGAVGAAVASGTAQVLGVSFGTGYYLLWRRGFRLPTGKLARVAAAALVAGLSALPADRYVHGVAGIIVAVGSAGLVYGPALIVTGAVGSDEVALLRQIGDALPSTRLQYRFAKMLTIVNKALMVKANWA
jgi:O-antigen/teichoic acid export membrane protein